MTEFKNFFKCIFYQKKLQTLHPINMKFSFSKINLIKLKNLITHLYFMHSPSSIDQTSIQGTALTYSPDGTYLLTVNHPTESSSIRKIHFYRFSDQKISSYTYAFSQQDMQYPSGEDNYALTTFNGNAICYVMGWKYSGGFSMAKITYSKQKGKVEGNDFFYWDMIGRSDLKQSAIQFHPLENAIIFIDDSSLDRLLIGERDFTIFTASDGENIETFEIIQSSEFPSYMSLLNYQNNNEKYWKIVRVDELDYMNAYNVTGSIQLGKNLGEVKFFQCDSKTWFCCVGFQNKKFFSLSRDLEISKELNKRYDEVVFTQSSKVILGSDKQIVEVWQKEMEQKISKKDFSSQIYKTYESVDAWVYEQSQYLFFVRHGTKYEIFTPQFQVFSVYTSERVLTSFSSKMADKITFIDEETLFLNTFGNVWIIIAAIFGSIAALFILCFLCVGIQKLCDFCKCCDCEKETGKPETVQKERTQKLNIECSICLQKNNLDVYIEYCRHVFHEKCLMYWLGSKNRGTCPVCRQSFRKINVRPIVRNFITEQFLTEME